jgi:hypothetical protein
VSAQQRCARKARHHTGDAIFERGNEFSFTQSQRPPLSQSAAFPFKVKPYALGLAPPIEFPLSPATCWWRRPWAPWSSSVLESGVHSAMWLERGWDLEEKRRGGVRPIAILHDPTSLASPRMTTIIANTCNKSASPGNRKVLLEVTTKLAIGFIYLFIFCSRLVELVSLRRPLKTLWPR